MSNAIEIANKAKIPESVELRADAICEIVQEAQMHPGEIALYIADLSFKYGYMQACKLAGAMNRQERRNIRTGRR